MRPAKNSEGDQIRTFVTGVLEEFGFRFDSLTTDADLTDIESSYLADGGMFVLLLDSDGTLVGTVGVARLDQQRCELRKMYLAKNCRGQGLGKWLLESAIQHARRSGFHRIELQTASSLSAARRLYESFGFRSFTPDHISERCDRAYYLDVGDHGGDT
jgi:putative acetyltransferase